MLDGLGFLPGSNCPHYNDESDRRPSYQKFMSSGDISSGIAQDQPVALHFRGTDLYRVLTTGEGCAAHKVSLHNDSVVEAMVVAEVLNQ